jgi:hypothetical protein
MSHFTVLVKVTKEKLAEHEGDTGKAIAAMLAPYQENNMGDCPEEFMEFNDTEEEYRSDYAENTVTRVVLEDGSLVERFDERFRVEKIGIGTNTHKVPDHLEQREVPLNELYPTFEEFMRDYVDIEKDEKTGKYGYWENPNRKWDWYQVGGRWSGMLPVKVESESAQMGERSWGNANEPDEPCTADLCQVKDLDFGKMDSDVDIAVDKFWAEYQRYKEIEAGDKPKEGEAFIKWQVTDTLQSLGIIRCVKEREPMVDENGEPILEEDGRTKWTEGEFDEDDLTLEDLKTKYRYQFEFGTFAALDETGWQERGEMGWWGMSTDTVDDKREWCKSFMDKFIKNQDPETTLAVVDCHI